MRTGAESVIQCLLSPYRQYRQTVTQAGGELDRSPVFFAGSQLRHRIREALLIGACKSAGGRLPLKDHFMLIQGVAIGGLA